MRFQTIRLSGLKKIDKNLTALAATVITLKLKLVFEKEALEFRTSATLTARPFAMFFALCRTWENCAENCRDMVSLFNFQEVIYGDNSQRIA